LSSWEEGLMMCKRCLTPCKFHAEIRIDDRWKQNNILECIKKNEEMELYVKIGQYNFEILEEFARLLCW
jgi:hypothetical protein